MGIDIYDESNDLVKNNQDNDLNDIKLTNLDSIIINREPTSDNELANKNYLDDELDKNTIVRFNQTISNYLKVSVGNDTYNLTKNDKIQLTDVTEIRYPNTGGYLLQNWLIKCNDENNKGKIQNFIRSTNDLTPSPDTGSNTLSPIGKSYLYIETSSNNHGSNVYCSFERTDIIQISRISFH